MVEINNTTKNRINAPRIKKICEKFLKYHQKTGKEVSIAIVGDTAMRRLNKTYRGIDKPTDVLAFPGEKNFLGEVIIDFAQVKRQAGLYSRNTQEEFIFILIHGLVHLLGYEDSTEKGRQRMVVMVQDFLVKIKTI